MPTFIIHKDGVYNLYTTVADGCYFTRGITLDELRTYTREEYGETGMRELPARLERAHRTGCSAIYAETLEGIVSCNRAGKSEAHVPFDEFVERFLTLPPFEGPQPNPTAADK